MSAGIFRSRQKPDQHHKLAQDPSLTKEADCSYCPLNISVKLIPYDKIHVQVTNNSLNKLAIAYCPSTKKSPEFQFLLHMNPS